MTHEPSSRHTDRALRDATLAAIAWVAHATSDVDVEVHDRIVRVRGSVRCIADRDRVLTAALGAPGVQVVLDDLAVRTVHGPGTSDAAVAAQVLELLATMPSVHVEEVRIRVRRGVVTVGGAIPWPFERDTLLNLVGAVPGVVDVIDALVLRRTDRVPEVEAPADEAIRTSGSSPHRG